MLVDTERAELFSTVGFSMTLRMTLLFRHLQHSKRSSLRVKSDMRVSHYG